jgi:hypothetical protein
MVFIQNESMSRYLSFPAFLAYLNFLTTFLSARQAKVKVAAEEAKVRLILQVTVLHYGTVVLSRTITNKTTRQK